ncbi:hypothetical protein AERO8C_80020 [Aeromonas veronii]|uniref:Uncharacterized protein n=1 Tax=Aeromonas veronii TaxID=654 RepID=A0A653LE15_AERVE|nr:hypothetical protein AERO8C_80020 [Aeromonas veronii]
MVVWHSPCESRTLPGTQLNSDVKNHVTGCEDDTS